jgi:two-component system nitrogen regulation response regulator GlnG
MMNDAAAVLVVEDDASVREVLDMVFAQEPGIYYTVAAGGANGMAKLQDGPPDVLLTDIIMPRVSGIDLIQFARKRYPGIPVVAFSAKPVSDTNDLHQLIGGEVVCFVSKPLDLTALLDLVRTLAADRSWRKQAM